MHWQGDQRRFPLGSSGQLLCPVRPSRLTLLAGTQYSCCRVAKRDFHLSGGVFSRNSITVYSIRLRRDSSSGISVHLPNWRRNWISTCSYFYSRLPSTEFVETEYYECFAGTSPFLDGPLKKISLGHTGTLNSLFSCDRYLCEQTLLFYEYFVETFSC